MTRVRGPAGPGPALITGASSGIGAAAAALLAARGWDLLLTGRDAAALAAVAGRTGGRWHGCDLALPGGPDRLAEWAREQGPPEVLLLNAGVGWAGALTAMTGPEVDTLVGLDLTAAIQLTRLLLPALLERGRGRVLLVSSIAGRIGVRDEAAYSAAKAGLIGFADALRWEVHGTGVGVSVIIPGVVETPFFSRRGQPYQRGWPRPIPAERVAGAVLRALDTGAAEIFVPGWLRLPARLHGAAPALSRALARRFG